MTNDDLKNIQSLNLKDLRLGIPAKLFAAGIAIPIIVAIQMSMTLGIALLVAVMLPIYMIHKEDPEAFSLYLDEFLTPQRFVIHPLEIKPILIILDSGEVVEYEDFEIPERQLTNVKQEKH